MFANLKYCQPFVMNVRFGVPVVVNVQIGVAGGMCAYWIGEAAGTSADAGCIMKMHGNKLIAAIRRSRWRSLAHTLRMMFIMVLIACEMGHLH